ncbi:GNAT family N-acetyltransferase [Crateriforma conspicua]|uniref:Putative N-acetyltransferase YafP n=1 Tax=Crateriforma conspicua TaxID=2527996 RepID=A0A5C5XZG4_9PLAN|nr:GNAT family N-acetyltransferase [Crateriforma conspicua]TWT68836.1 putative N-acetyltransferase YafP [Crateriforma conspicua]
MGSAAPRTLRPFRCDDAEACLALLRDCVHRVNSRDYDPDQIKAWASPTIDLERWRARFDDRFAYVATEDDCIVGFTDMTREGHLDRLFVSADHQGRGIARGLVRRLLKDAIDHSIEEITTDASITAKPFFERMGFSVVREQSVECRGVWLTNYRMRRAVQAEAN